MIGVDLLLRFFVAYEDDALWDLDQKTSVYTSTTNENSHLVVDPKRDVHGREHLGAGLRASVAQRRHLRVLGPEHRDPRGWLSDDKVARDL